MEKFLWVDKIPGESIDAVGGGPPHIDDIQLQDWRWSIANNAPRGMTDKDKITQHTTVADLIVTKWIDLATKPLLEACALGTVINKATLTLRKSAGDYKHEYFVVDFTDLKVMDVNWPQGGEDRTETVKFRFATFKLKYKMQDNTGEGKPPLDFGWDQFKFKVI